MSTKNFWTEERQNTLIRLWKEGIPSRAIAEQLGEGITRNAVIGKANRLGLSQQGKKPEKPEPDHVIVPSAKQCQWPFGDPGDANFHFCGKPVQPDWPYCPEHCLLAYRSLSDKEDDVIEEKGEEESAKQAADTPKK